MTESLLSVIGLKKWFLGEPGFIASLLKRGKTTNLRAVDSVTFSVDEGEILGVAGESGCGKTTLGMTLVKLYDPTEGEIRFQGRDIAPFHGRELKDYHRMAQIIFQNPYESLNPRLTVLETVLEPLKIHGVGDRVKRVDVAALALESSGLAPAEDFFHRFPHELSGGQRQRIAIARAIVLEPKFLVADEPVSMLDVSIRAGILNLLSQFSQRMGMAILFISHDLATIRQISNRTAIMYLGRIVELGPTEEIIQKPLHPYSQALVAAVPIPDPDLDRENLSLEMEISSAIDLPPGCRFHPRCPDRKPECLKLDPTPPGGRAGPLSCLHFLKKRISPLARQADHLFLAQPQFLYTALLNKGGGEEPKRGEGPSCTLNRGAISWPRIDGSGSAMEGRGVGDKPAKKREARLLTKGAQLPCSACMKALPLAYSGPMSMGKLGLGKSSFSLDIQWPFGLIYVGYQSGLYLRLSVGFKKALRVSISGRNFFHESNAVHRAGKGGNC